MKLTESWHYLKNTLMLSLQFFSLFYLGTAYIKVTNFIGVLKLVIFISVGTFAKLIAYYS